MEYIVGLIRRKRMRRRLMMEVKEGDHTQGQKVEELKGLNTYQQVFEANISFLPGIGMTESPFERLANFTL